MDKKDIILFCPDTNEGLDRVTPPLGLLAVAAPLLKEYRVNIIDSRVERDFEKKVFSLLEKGAIIVGITAMTGPQIKSGRSLAGKIKEKFPKTPVVWGGWHSSILPEQTVMDPAIDIVVRGQGEVTFYELIKRLEANRPLTDLPGVTFKQDGQVVSNPPRAIEELEKFPPLPFQLIDLKKYPGRRKTTQDVFITYRVSQGCPWRCAYCADPLVFNRKWTGLRPSRAVSEIDDLINKYGVTEIIFVDDTFVINEKYVREFSEEVLKRNLKFEWQACARIGTIAKMSDETLRLMRDAGCVQIHPGVEAATQELLDLIKKDEKLENLWACAEKLARVGIRALYSFMVTFPGEPKDAISKTFEIIKRLKKIDPNNVCPVNFYIPFPGNDLYQLCIDHGFNPPQTLAEWETFNTRSGDSTPWITRQQKYEVISKDKYYFPAAFPSATLLKKMSAPGFWGLVYRTFHRIAKFRVERNWYALGIDWWLLFAYWKFWQYFNRKLPLHNIMFR